MQLYDTEKIHAIVSELKDTKTKSFQRNSGLTDFKKVTETCRILDTFILPLYYIWEHCLHQQLKELGFEEHLEKPYQRFLQNPLTNTWELYLFISIKTPFDDVLSNNKLSKEITNIYKVLIDNCK